MKLIIETKVLPELMRAFRKDGEDLNDYFVIGVVGETTPVEGQMTLSEFTEPEEKPVKQSSKVNSKRKKTTKRRKGTGKKIGRPKGSKNKPKKKKATYSRNKYVRTAKPPYGWDRSDDGKKLVPNWEEQNNIEWMKAQIVAGQSAMGVAEILNKKKIKGKNGGQWYSSGILACARDRDHSDREKFPKPEWFDTRIPRKLF